MGTDARDEGTIGPITDSDMDSLYVLPLSVIPFQTETLRRSRLIKNQRMENVVEIYAGDGLGSGQIDVAALPQHFNWRDGGQIDYEIVRKLSTLPSFDVYTVRRSLSSLNLPIENIGELRLTDEKRRQLAGYMQRFTLPLIHEIYGDAAQGLRGFDELVALLRDPDIKNALSRLKQMAKRLSIAVEELPRFIEDYADSFLLVSYYNQCLDRLAPLAEQFLSTVNSLRLAVLVRRDQNLRIEFGRQEKAVAGLVKFLKRIFEEIGVLSRDLWRNLSAERFAGVRASIENTQVQIASVLCGLTVKLNGWIRKFPTPKVTSGITMIEFIMSDIRPGMAELVAAARGASG